MAVQNVTIHGWSGVELRAADVSLVVTPQIGGRIMSLRFKGEELLYVHPPEAGKTHDLKDISDIVAYKKDFGFHIIGGDKTWVAPEWDWAHKIPPLELDVSPYTLELRETRDERPATERLPTTSNAQRLTSLVMTSPVCRETGIQITRHLTLFADGKIVLQEDLVNTNPFEIKKGAWNVTQIIKPFDVYLQSIEHVRSYHLQDATLPAHDIRPEICGRWVKIPCSSDVCFKFGALLTLGRAVVVRETPQGAVALVKSFPSFAGAEYPHGSSVEVFNSSEFPYGELEVHSLLCRIPPKGRVSQVQEWRLCEIDVRKDFLQAFI